MTLHTMDRTTPRDTTHGAMALHLFGDVRFSFRSYAARKIYQVKKKQELHRASDQPAESRMPSGLTTLSRNGGNPSPGAILCR
jgi:hypothetical protein